MEEDYTNNNHSDNTADMGKVKFHVLAAATKLQAYNELDNFVKKSSLGINCKITEKTIDDAFEYMINIGKAIINAIDLPKKVKESSELCTESDFLAIKENLKLLLNKS